MGLVLQTSTDQRVGRGSMRLIASLLVWFFTGVVVAAEDLPDSNLEATVCGPFVERWAFQNWSSAAGSPEDSLVAMTPTAMRQEFRTGDRRTLVGFHLPAEPTVANRGSLLFIQGNGMLVDRALRWLQPFSSAGLDVYLFDFRGYGRSNGNRRLQAMVSDYQALLRHLASRANRPLHVYGISFGGVLLANSLQAVPSGSRAVIDATPSVVSTLGCPTHFNPVDNVPDAAGSLLFIAGGKDEVVPMKATQLIRERVAGAGGQVLVLDEHAHPFQGSPEMLKSRLKKVLDFLLDSSGAKQ